MSGSELCSTLSDKHHVAILGFSPLSIPYTPNKTWECDA